MVRFRCRLERRGNMLRKTRCLSLIVTVSATAVVVASAATPAQCQGGGVSHVVGLWYASGELNPAYGASAWGLQYLAGTASHHSHLYGGVSMWSSGVGSKDWFCDLINAFVHADDDYYQPPVRYGPSASGTTLLCGYGTPRFMVTAGIGRVRELYQSEYTYTIANKRSYQYGLSIVLGPSGRSGSCALTIGRDRYKGNFVGLTLIGHSPGRH